MTLRIDGTDVTSAIEIAAMVGGIISMLVIGLLIYLMVRPPRKLKARALETDPLEAEEMLRLMERMEQRLEVLERAVTVEADEVPRISKTNGEAREAGRIK